MIRMQIRIIGEQERALKRLASRGGKSVAELIRLSVDSWLQTSGIMDCDELMKENKMNVSEAIQHKHAIRSFRNEPLPEEIIHKILNAGRRAQSAKNMQAWHFIAIQKRATLKALSGMGTFAGHLANAALGIAIITPPPETRFSIMFDAGQAAAYMQLAAWEMGVGSCLATIYEPEKARQLLGFPTELEIHIAISFGYPADATNLSRSPQKGGRKPFSESVHWEKWEI